MARNRDSPPCRHPSRPDTSGKSSWGMGTSCEVASNGGRTWCPNLRTAARNRPRILARRRRPPFHDPTNVIALHTSRSNRNTRLELLRKRRHRILLSLRSPNRVLKNGPQNQTYRITKHSVEVRYLDDLAELMVDRISHAERFTPRGAYARDLELDEELGAFESAEDARAGGLRFEACQ